MLAYIMQFDIGSRNCIADALSRMYQDSSIQERLDNVGRYMHERDDFILPVMRKSALRTLPIEPTDRPHNAQCGEHRKSPKTAAIATRSMSKQLTIVQQPNRKSGLDVVLDYKVFLNADY